MFRRNLLCPLIVLSFVPMSFADEAAIFDELDSNSDGLLQQDEVAEEHVRLFNRLIRIADENEDRALSRSEFIAGTTRQPAAANAVNPGNRAFQGGFPSNAPRPRFDVQQLIDRLDRNGDKKLSRDEVPDRLRQNFDRVDANQDDQLDAAEFRRVAEAMRNRANRNDSPPPADANNAAALAKRIFQQRDADKNGRVTLDEIPQQRQAGYRRLLTQYDVAPETGLNEQQFTQAFARLFQRRPQP